MPLCVAAAVLGVVVAPAAAVAVDGPGYAGTADTVTVRWQDETGGVEGLAVYAVGFRGGSTVALRVGSATGRTVYADPAGAVEVLVVSVADIAKVQPAAGMSVLPIDTGAVGRLSPGMSVQATGRDPAGGVRNLVGAVPPPAAGRGVQDLAPWGALAAVLVGSALLARRPVARRLGPAVRRYDHSARHGTGVRPGHGVRLLLPRVRRHGSKR